MDIIINKELQDLIPAMPEGQKVQLIANLKADGCRDALVVWREKGILLDGHNRYEICKKYKIKYTVTTIPIKDMEEAKFWMINNQLGRRNLTPDQFTNFLGMKYNTLKKEQGRPNKIGQVDPINSSTAKQLAKEHGVSESTVKRAGKKAEAIQNDPEAQKAILEGRRPPRRPPPSQKAKPADGKVLDVIGREIPGNLVELWNKREDPLAICNGLTQIKSLLNKAEGNPAFVNIHVQTAVSDVNRLFHQLKESVFYAVCGMCQGIGCKACKCGLMSRHQWETHVPRETKDMILKGIKK